MMKPEVLKSPRSSAQNTIGPHQRCLINIFNETREKRGNGGGIGKKIAKEYNTKSMYI